MNDRVTDGITVEQLVSELRNCGLRHALPENGPLAGYLLLSIAARTTRQQANRLEALDALEAQLTRAIEALVTGDGISLLCPEGGCRCPDPDGIERRRLRNEATDADLDACRDCWRAHLGAAL